MVQSLGHCRKFEAEAAALCGESVNILNNLNPMAGDESAFQGKPLKQHFFTFLLTADSCKTPSLEGLWMYGVTGYRYCFTVTTGGISGGRLIDSGRRSSQESLSLTM